MKFLHESEFSFKYFLICSCLILNVYAAKPFSTSSTSTSSFGSGSRFSGSASRTGSSFGSTSLSHDTAKFNTAGSSRSSTTHYISIADSKTSLRSGFNAPNKSPIFGLGSTSALASFNPSLKAGNDLRAPEKQPPFNPIYKPGTNTQVAAKVNSNTLLSKPINTNSGSVLTNKCDALSKQPALNPFLNVAAKPPTPPNSTANLMPRQPAFNPFFNPGMNVGANVTKPNGGFNSSLNLSSFNSLHQGLNSNTTRFVPKNVTNSTSSSSPLNFVNNYPHFKDNLNTTRIVPKNATNSTSPSSPLNFIKSFPPFKANTTRIVPKNTTNSTLSPSPLNFIRSFPHFEALDLQSGTHENTDRGYTASTIHRHHVNKSQHDVNKELQNQKPNHKNLILISVAIIALVVSIIVGIIILKLRAP